MPAGRGRRSATAQDRQAEAAKEAQLKGPHNFPLQRLLLILRVLARNEGQAQEELLAVPGGHGGVAQLLAGPGQAAGGGCWLDSSDVLMQVSSLVSMKLLQQVSGARAGGRAGVCVCGSKGAVAVQEDALLCPGALHTCFAVWQDQVPACTHAGAQHGRHPEALPGADTQGLS